MRCVVIETCWPNADTAWRKGEIVDVDAPTYNLLERFLQPMAKKRVVEKVVIKDEVKDGAEK